MFISIYIQKLDGVTALKLPLDDVRSVGDFTISSDLDLEMDVGVRCRKYVF